MSDRMMSLKADADYTFDSDSDSDVESGRRAPPMTKSKTEPSLGHVHSVNGGWACDQNDENHWYLCLLTWPMDRQRLNFKLFGITYLVGKIKFKLLSQGPGRLSESYIYIKVFI